MQNEKTTRCGTQKKSIFNFLLYILVYVLEVFFHSFISLSYVSCHN